MNDELLLAIDAGTGSCRAMVFDIEGRQVAMGQREYIHDALPEVPGSQVFDTEKNWRLICECVREALVNLDPSAVKAVSATSMREGMVLYDTHGRVLWACPNVDARAGEQAAQLIESGAADEIYRQAGDWVSITAPARFLWIAEHEPSVFASIAHVGMLGDWILTRLSGAFVTDPSLGSSSGMFDLASRTWSPRVLEICNIDPSVFPPLVDCGTVVGAVTPTAAAETGLERGTPVVAGGADTQLGLLGIGVAQPGRVTVVGGSFWQCTVVLDEPLVDPLARLRTLCHTVPDRWMMEGIGFYSGLVMRWFRDAFCELEAIEAAQTGETIYAIMERKAATLPPGSHGVVGVFANVMQASRWVQASPAFVGFNVSDPPRAGRIECFRAIQESAVYATRGHLRIIEELTGITVQEAVLTGGAAKGVLWPQIVADILDIDVSIPEVKESTALGAALYAGVGVGLYADAVEAATRLARLERSLSPAPHSAHMYNTLYEQWLGLYRRSLEISEAGLVRPMWRPPGA